MSVAYYKECHGRVLPRLTAFIKAMDQFFAANGGVSRAPAQRKELRRQLITASTFVTRRLEAFDRLSRTMWDQVSAERCHAIAQSITQHHTTLGGVLSGLVVKANHWDHIAATADGDPFKNSENVIAEMHTGMTKLKELRENATPVMGDTPEF